MPKFTSFAKRTQWALEPNALTHQLERLRAQNVPLLDLTESNPTQCGFSYPDRNIIKALHNDNNLKYFPDAQGLEEARRAVCSYYKEKNMDVTSDQVFLTSSTSEAYTYLFRLLANPRDHVLFPRPSYPLFSFLGDLNDVCMDTYPLVFEGQWRIDLQALDACFCRDTKAIVFVNPNNPTGSFVGHQEIKAVNALCRDRGIALICDEVFSDFSIDPKASRCSLVNNEEILTFVLGGISKTLGLPQMKLSWIIVSGPQDDVKAAKARLEVIADTYLSVNAPTQNALKAWLACRGEIQDNIRERIRQNYEFLHEQVSAHDGCRALETQGGWYAVLKIEGLRAEEKWALELLAQDHVYVHPGYFFDFEEEGFVVISLLSERAIFKEGLARLLARVSSGAFKLEA